MNEDLSRDELMKRVNWYSGKFGPYVEKKGLHNWKNLFKKPTMSEMIVLVMLIMALFLWWTYSHDIKECKIIVAECNEILNPTIPNQGSFNFSDDFDFSDDYLIIVGDEEG